MQHKLNYKLSPDYAKKLLMYIVQKICSYGD